MTVIAAGAVVVADRVCRPGWVSIASGRIIDCGSGAPPSAADDQFPDCVVVPGFIDMHVHGGGGFSYTDGVADEVQRAAEFHRAHGATTTMASLVTASPPDLLRQVRVLAPMTRQGSVAGIHLEGPWLSAARCGAHAPALLRAPDFAEIDTLLEAADGAIRMVTLAPELPGALEAIRFLTDANVVVAVGHTDASYDLTRQAIEMGATVGTHVFNGMRPLHHRDPGPALALLEDPRVTVELIADGVHVHLSLVRQVIHSAGPDRVALITDAMAAAGLPDGSFRLGTVDIDVVDRIARVRGTATIAGGTATMDQLFRAAVETLGATDEALVAATRMTATTPARALGLSSVGSLQVGYAANLVVLDQYHQVTAVMADGEWLALS
ncbi:N-acetylglucosamine-6-phosphate deacetylase [Mycobacterium hubeiense]|uniref:N-acetylglucosamine-6-phosphate deacetylase n=1 Tax=Mycobacterium hubeiense TaxID=1867256 RepID=UPI000C7F3CA5|nr:N-acetylglucosamine-6-phosphate deacetylase [Mycobacterium sp. QGD 101]